MQFQKAPLGKKMPGIEQLSILMPISFGAVIINTMPIWLAELADHRQVSEPLAGGLGSLVLLTAAVACAVPARRKAGLFVRLCIPMALLVLALGERLSIIFIGLTCILLGAAFGFVTKRALHALQQEGDPLKLVSAALSIGLGFSFVIYLVLSASSLRVLWILVTASVCLLLVRPQNTPKTIRCQRHESTIDLPLGYVPFFIMMGAYWSFLELYGQSISPQGGMATWLLFSLVTGAIGSFVAGLIPPRHWRRVQAIALLAAVLTGAASYIAPHMDFLGFTIVANGFFLFLFFPIYIASRQDRAPMAMASYLLGFAFGGLVGAFVLQIAGYPGLGLAILASGFIAVLSGPNGLFHRS
ncbi:hypothetical protein [uncultured Ruegeria sp.]|uniref:hypothetical protein n=1 Tax=uncultured Ruegeria sp. TaxID=259304 RepID=UPI00260D31AF|nr:hypothetical protein [uncultured Ruegeria sp.]